MRYSKGNKEKKNLNYYVTKAYTASYNAILKKYKKSISGFIKRPKLAWALLAVAAVLLVFFTIASQNIKDAAPAHGWQVSACSISTCNLMWKRCLKKYVNTSPRKPMPHAFSTMTIACYSGTVTTGCWATSG